MFHILYYTTFASYHQCKRLFTTGVPRNLKAQETLGVSESDNDLLEDSKNSNTSKFNRRDLFIIVNEKDKGTETNNPHILVRRWRQSKEPLTLDFLNSLLPTSHPNARANTKVTPEILSYFKSLTDSDWLMKDLPLSPESRKELNVIIGSTEPDSRIRAKGVYAFFEKETNDLLYLGSSAHLTARGMGYLVPSRQARFSGNWGNYIRSNPKLDGCRVGFIALPEHLADYYIALEQFFLLVLNPRYNLLYVAMAGGGGKELSEETRLKMVLPRAHSTFMYERDRITLIHTFVSVRDAAKKLGFNHNSIHKGMSKDRNVLGFFFSTKLLPQTVECIRPIESLRQCISIASGR